MMIETDAPQVRPAESIDGLATPALVLDAAKMERNFARLSAAGMTRPADSDYETHVLLA